MHQTPRISVVIPTYNRVEILCRCVQSCLDTDYPDLEVIVVDDCSNDGTPKELARRYADDRRVRSVRNERNSLSAHSRNHGASIASGDYLFFLDDDNIVHPSILVEMVNVFRAHPEAGLVAPVTGNYDHGRLRVWTVGSAFNPWTSRGKDAQPIPEFVENIPNDISAYPTKYSPNAFMVSRAAFDAAGGFDEVMRMTFEESDFGYRVCEAGFSAFIAARAITEHYGYLDPDTTPVLRGLGIGRPARAFTFGRNRSIFARRHFTFLQALSVSLIFAPLSAIYYGLVALRNRRLDIALAYVTGTLCGMFGLYPKSVFNWRVGLRPKC